jgi:DtxR family Mn-dependent transcriptional regulator
MRRGRKKEITAHLIDYLVVVYEISKESDTKSAKVSQIARRMGVSLPSVTNAMKRLSALGFVNYKKYNVITLTSKGKKLAQEKVGLQERLRDFFMRIIGLQRLVADRLARAFSHYIDDKTEKRLRRFYEILKDFDESKVKELLEFIEESKKLSGV